MHRSPFETCREALVDHLGPSEEQTDGVLIVDDEPQMRSFLERALEPKFSRVETAANAEEARVLADSPWFQVLVVDVRLPGPMGGRELVAEIRDRCPANFDVIFVTGYPEVFVEISSKQEAAVHVLRKPFQIGELIAAVDHARLRRKSGAAEPAAEAQTTGQPVRISNATALGVSEQMRAIWDTVQRIAPMPSTVLVKGETGTGKEVVARALHDLSGCSGQYVPINCGAISAELIEGELFGHLKGAFTGAHQARDGLFRHADGGTLLLDEIGEMPYSMQAKLLRVLEERRYRPVGGSQEIPVNARIIAASNRDLADEVAAGRFRKDLFYRLNVVDLELPPLRERKSDIPWLAEHFLDLLAAELSVTKPGLTGWDVELLKSYDWPGNCRELRNVIERSLLLGKPIGHFVCPSNGVDEGDKVAATTDGLSLEAVERAHILRAVNAAGGNKSVAARVLGVSRKTVERKLKKWCVQCETD